MRANQIEAKLNSIHVRIKAGQAAVEDQLVELKREWPSQHHKAARQIAASCNAALGQEVIIAYGMDQKEGAIGCDPADFANWWAQVVAEFVEGGPLMQHYCFRIDGADVCALSLSTDRAPYLVRARDVNTVVYEIPWRRGTATRTASRGELLSLLNEQVSRPSIELDPADVEVIGRAGLNEAPPYKIQIRVSMYILPTKPCVIPFHRSHLQVTWLPVDDEVSNWGGGAICPVQLQPPFVTDPTHLGNIRSGPNELIVEGPGAARAFAVLPIDFETKPVPFRINFSGTLRLGILPGDIEVATPVAFPPLCDNQPK